MLKSILMRYVPRRVVDRVRRVCYFPRDTIEGAFGLRDELTPPRGLSRYIGQGDFRRVGNHFLEHLIHLGQLRPDNSVLDVGCGIGRVAVPLTTYLEDRAIYEGFDIVPEGITWCQKTISSRYPNFRFRLADVYNRQYNPKGRYDAPQYRFPFEARSFDFVFLGSVFTHMLPDGMENYLSEISRVLKDGGRSFITFFLLNPESLASIRAKSSTRDFCIDLPRCRTIDKRVPERAVAYDEALVRDLYRVNRLKIAEPVRYGSWYGRKESVTYQDVVLATKLDDETVGA